MLLKIKKVVVSLSHHIDLNLVIITEKILIFNLFNEKKITIAIDAMGGDNSPDKTVGGVGHFLSIQNKTVQFKFVWK